NLVGYALSWNLLEWFQNLSITIKYSGDFKPNNVCEKMIYDHSSKTDQSSRVFSILWMGLISVVWIIVHFCLYYNTGVVYDLNGLLFFLPLIIRVLDHLLQFIEIEE